MILASLQKLQVGSVHTRDIIIDGEREAHQVPFMVMGVSTFEAWVIEHKEDLTSNDIWKAREVPFFYIVTTD